MVIFCLFIIFIITLIPLHVIKYKQYICMGHKTYMYFLFFIPQQNSSEENTAFIQVQTCSLQVYVIFVFSGCSSINSSKVVDQNV